MEELDHCLEAAHVVINVVQNRLKNTDDNNKKSLKSSVALMLYLMAKLDTVQSSQNTIEDLKQTRAGMKNSALEAISRLLKNWMQHGGMGTRFGLLYSPEVEIEVILHYTCSKPH